MRKQGATTLWETWKGEVSHNHPMFGACIKQLFYGLFGLQADAGFANVTLSPKYIDGIGFIRAKLRLPSGTLRVAYRYQNGEVTVTYKSSGKLKVHLQK